MLRLSNQSEKSKPKFTRKDSIGKTKPTKNNNNSFRNSTCISMSCFNHTYLMI